MSGSARSRVDFHLANAHELVRLADAQGDRGALASSICLQFEIALGFYLLELLQNKRENIVPWPLDGKVLAELARQRDVADMHELVDLSQDEETWLHRMLRRLELLRECTSGRPIKAEIFHSDLEEPTKSNDLIVSSRNPRKPSMDVRALAVDLQAFASLVSRQRLGHEEY